MADSSAGFGSLGTLHVRRVSATWRDTQRKYKVVLDGKVVGTVADGGEFVTSVAAGTHRVRMKIDFAGSSTEEFDLAAGQTISYETEPNGSATGALLDLVLVLFKRKQYVDLRRADDAWGS